MKGKAESPPREGAAGGRPGSALGQSLQGLQCHSREPGISRLAGLVSRVACLKPAWLAISKDKAGALDRSLGWLWRRPVQQKVEGSIPS